jgi:hypothetical protein
MSRQPTSQGLSSTNIRWDNRTRGRGAQDGANEVGKALVAAVAVAQRQRRWGGDEFPGAGMNDTSRQEETVKPRQLGCLMST